MIAVLTGANLEKVAPSVFPEPRRRADALRFDDLPDTDANRKALEDAAKAVNGDVFFFHELPSLTTVRLAFFDMDSTLIENECIDDMAAFFGVGDAVADITRLAMEGHLPFTENLRRRAALLKGAPESVLTRTIENVRLTKGVEKLALFLRGHGVKCFILTGGFRPIAQDVAKRLGFDGTVTNEIVTADGRLTGEVTGPAGGAVLDADGKRRAVEVITALHGCTLHNAMATGDGANDIEMVRAAGLGVAFHGKAVLRDAADVAVCRGGLDTLIPLFEEAWVNG